VGFAPQLVTDSFNVQGRFYKFSGSGEFNYTAQTDSNSQSLRLLLSTSDLAIYIDLVSPGKPDSTSAPYRPYKSRNAIPEGRLKARTPSAGPTFTTSPTTIDSKSTTPTITLPTPPVNCSNQISYTVRSPELNETWLVFSLCNSQGSDNYLLNQYYSSLLKDFILDFFRENNLETFTCGNLRGPLSYLSQPPPQTYIIR
jgi:hypothetical protein